MYTSLVPRLTVVNLVTPVPALTIGVCIRLTSLRPFSRLLSLIVHDLFAPCLTTKETLSIHIFHHPYSSEFCIGRFTHTLGELLRGRLSCFDMLLVRECMKVRQVFAETGPTRTAYASCIQDRIQQSFWKIWNDATITFEQAFNYSTVSSRFVPAYVIRN